MSDRFTLIFAWLCSFAAGSIAYLTREQVCLYAAAFTLSLAISYSIVLFIKRRFQRACEEYELREQQLREHITKVTK